MSLDQGYNNNNKMSPQLKLPNLKMAYVCYNYLSIYVLIFYYLIVFTNYILQKKETLVGHGHNGHNTQGGRLCAVCAKKHNPNQPHIV